MAAKKSTKRKPKKTAPDVGWYDILLSARPLLVLAIEFLIHTKKLGSYGKALRLLSIAIDRVLPEDGTQLLTAIRTTRNELRSLGKAKPAKQRRVLNKLKTQITEL